MVSSLGHNATCAKRKTYTSLYEFSIASMLMFDFKPQYLLIERCHCIYMVSQNRDQIDLCLHCVTPFVYTICCVSQQRFLVFSIKGIVVRFGPHSFQIASPGRKKLKGISCSLLSSLDTNPNNLYNMTGESYCEDGFYH